MKQEMGREDFFQHNFLMLLGMKKGMRFVLVCYCVTIQESLL